MSRLVGSLLVSLLLYATIQVCICLVDFCPPVARVGSDYRLECSFSYNNSWRNYNWLILDRKHGSDWSNLASCHDLKCTNFTRRASAVVIVGDGRSTRSSLLLHNLTAQDSGSTIRCESWNQEAMSLHRHVLCRLDVRSILEASTLKEGIGDLDSEEIPTASVISDSTTHDLGLNVQANSTNATLSPSTTTRGINDSEKKNSTITPIHHSTVTIDFSSSANQLTLANDDQVKLTALSVVESSTVHRKDIFIYCALAAIFCLLVFIVIVMVRRNKNSSNPGRSHDQSPAYHSTNTNQDQHSYTSVHFTDNPCEVLPPLPRPHHRQQHIYSEPESFEQTFLKNFIPSNCHPLDCLDNSITSNDHQLDTPDDERVRMIALESIYIDPLAESDQYSLSLSELSIES